MEFTIKTGSPAKSRTGILVLGAFADGVLPAPTAAVDAAAEGRISQLLKRGDLDDKAGSTLLLSGLDGSHAERVLLVSLGNQDEFGDKAYRDALAAAAKVLAATPAKDAVVALADVVLAQRALSWRLQQASRILADGAYRRHDDLIWRGARRGDRLIGALAARNGGKRLANQGLTAARQPAGPGHQVHVQTAYYHYCCWHTSILINSFSGLRQTQQPTAPLTHARQCSA